jgi:hypothetical protein
MTMSYPLAWPAGRARTPFPTPAKFAKRENNGRYDETKALTIVDGRDRLYAQLEKLGADQVDISTNLKLTLRGMIDKQPTPVDRGVAVRFDLNGSSIVLACDKWDSIGSNMAAIAAHIDALRGQERWGVSDIKTAFSGHIALPNFSAREHWTKLLKLAAGASEADIQSAWRMKIREAKTEADQMDINIARDEALTERGFR